MAYHLDLRVLTAQEVAGLLTCEEVVAVVEETFRRAGAGLLFHPIKEPIWLNEDHSNMIKSMSAHLKDVNIAGIKWVSMMGRQQPGLPTCGGNLLILTDGTTGLPYALIEASGITTMRTGGGHGVVAAKYLAKKEPKTLTIIGCGAEGQAAAESFLATFPTLKQLRVFDRLPEAMAGMTERYGKNIQVIHCGGPAEAAEQADILVLATTARTALIRAGDVPDGCLVIGLYGFFDLDAACAIQADKWVLGSWDQDTLQILNNPAFQKYDLRREQVYADLGQIVQGSVPGRQNESETIVYTHFGMGALDVAVGDLVYRKAVQAGTGQILRMC